MGQRMGDNEGNAQAYIPLSLLQDTLSTKDLGSITCQADSTDNVDKVANEIARYLFNVRPPFTPRMQDFRSNWLTA